MRHVHICHPEFGTMWSSRINSARIDAAVLCPLLLKKAIIVKVKKIAATITSIVGSKLSPLEPDAKKSFVNITSRTWG